MFCEKHVPVDFAKLTRKHLARDSFVINLQASRNFSTGIFLRILQNFYEHLFCRTAWDSYFFIYRASIIWLDGWPTKGV